MLSVYPTNCSGSGGSLNCGDTQMSHNFLRKDQGWLQRSLRVTIHYQVMKLKHNKLTGYNVNSMQRTWTNGKKTHFSYLKVHYISINLVLLVLNLNLFSDKLRSYLNQMSNGSLLLWKSLMVLFHFHFSAAFITSVALLSPSPQHYTTSLFVPNTEVCLQSTEVCYL